MSKTTTADEKALDFSFAGNLVSEAMLEYYANHDQVVSELQTRAEALIKRIMPEHRAAIECYHGEGESVFCDVEELNDGFGVLSLSFHKGATPETDYFLIENYLELPSPVEIRTLYDLGRALCELTDLAQGVLRTFRHTMLGCPKTDDMTCALN